MNKFAALTISASLLVGFSAPAFSQEFTKGEVTKVDAEQKKVTIKHEELKNLEMPAMTMVFNVADDAMLEKAQVGKNVEFVAERVKGKITIVELK